MVPFPNIVYIDEEFEPALTTIVVQDPIHTARGEPSLRCTIS